ncbi:MAG: adenylyl-sulfate kinase [Rickettsiales bacterium]|nr:adenylyl-sulfate kinase [Rickettsiales bacterium]|tara:strand:- start:2021 stop:3889 length:1869 start_codon:yes stop_codon:yes gene_type:complete
MSFLENEEIPKVVIVGHVDHGKSSLIGRLMYDLDEVPSGKYEELKLVSEKRGMEFEFAFLLDALQAERDQGITIDTTQIFFKTKKRKYVFIDAPGHKEFIRNMITGASSADIAVLIIDAHEGLKEQTKKHAYLLKLLGLDNVICLFNKMDKINYDEKKFLKVEKELSQFINNIAVNIVATVPVSAKCGDNIIQKSKKLSWYNGQAFCEILDSYNLKKGNDDLPLRLPIQDIYKIDDKRVIVGRIETGEIKLNDELFFLPSNETVKLKSFEAWPKAKKKYVTGDNVGLTIEDQIFIDKGNLISHVKFPPKLMNTFEANIFWLSEKKLKIDKQYLMKINTGEYNIVISKVSKVLDTNNLSSKTLTLSPKKNDVCEVIIHSSQLIPMDDFKDNQKTGRFCILDEEKIIAGGIINLQNFPDQKDVIQTKNIKPISFSVTEIDRALRFNHRSAIIWMTGLSGSGKSTIAKEIEKKLFLKNYNVFILDGDNLRMGINRGLGFSTEDRTENIRRAAEVAKLFTQAGFIVIVSLISPYISERKKARDIKPEIFKEIFVKASIDECKKRDVKGLYSKAISGEIENFTGISSPYEDPKNPDLILNTERESIEESVNKLENFIIKEFGVIKNS